VAWPSPSRAKESTRVQRIGVLANKPWPAVEGLHVGLDELGYHEGKDFLVEYRFAEGAVERFPELAAELVGLPVNVLVTSGTPATLAALKATISIPIVMSAGDPIGAGVAASLARPGGNVTGLTRKPQGVKKNDWNCLRSCGLLFHGLRCWQTRQTRTAQSPLSAHNEGQRRWASRSM
jgi:hypothetical protein